MKIGIIGAGASGMMAAITAADYGARVTLFEKNDRVGKKILATGNGKCNISNMEFHMDKYYCDDKNKLQRIFNVFSVTDTCKFFEKNGMLVCNKNGYLYPYSQQASTVLDVFRKMLMEREIQVETECEVTSVIYRKDKYSFLIKANGRKWEFDKLIIACGGPASLRKKEGMTGFSIAKSLGHTIHKVVPGLVQLRTDETYFKTVAGVRCKAQIQLLVNHEKIVEEQGELQFTDYGLSGIPVFQFSREAAYATEAGKYVEASINFYPDMDKNTYEQWVNIRYETYKELTLEEFLLGTVNKKINQALIKKAGYKPGDLVSDIGFSKMKDFMMMYRQLKVHIVTVNSMENAQICAGGINFSEISTNMESLKCKGLYFAGEMIDVDGKCGGYNLQWAWTSGYIAGKNAVGKFYKG